MEVYDEWWWILTSTHSPVCFWAADCWGMLLWKNTDIKTQPALTERPAPTAHRTEPDAHTVCLCLNLSPIISITNKSSVWLPNSPHTHTHTHTHNESGIQTVTDEYTHRVSVITHTGYKPESSLTLIIPKSFLTLLTHTDTHTDTHTHT